MKKELKYVCSYIVCLGIVFCIVLLVRKNIYLKNVEQAEKNIYNKIDYSLVYNYDYYKTIQILRKVAIITNMICLSIL